MILLNVRQSSPAAAEMFAESLPLWETWRSSAEPYVLRGSVRSRGAKLQSERRMPAIGSGSLGRSQLVRSILFSNSG